MLESNIWRLSRLFSYFAIALGFAGASPAVPATPSAALPKIEGCHVGFRDQFKVGYWTPIYVSVTGAKNAANLTVEVTAVDGDGVPTTAAAPVDIGDNDNPSLSGSRSSVPPTLLYTKVGRMDSRLHVALVGDGREIDHFDLECRLGADSNHVGSLPATSELVLQIGVAPIGLADAIPDRDSSPSAPGRHLVRVEHLERLPTEWFGYDGVDLVVLSTADVVLCQNLAADSQRLAALQKWVELGGRLVLCAGRDSPKVIAPGEPLAQLAPGKFEDIIRLPQTRGLENFAESTAPIGMAGAQLAIAASRLAETTGQVEVYGRGNELPVVIRSARGFGELAFVGLDLDQPPLADWAGRSAFWHALLRPYLSTSEAAAPSQRLSSLGYTDLAGALHQQLGHEFVGVTAISFSLVATAILAYIALLGPVDYLFIHRFLRRPMVAWLSLPLLILFTCCGAAGISHWTKGSIPRANQAEIIDIDAATGTARGNYWSTVFSPASELFDLSFAPRLPANLAPEAPQSLLTWFGMPGSGLGGMHAGRALLDATQTGYRYSPGRNVLLGVPILTGSTKALEARWTALCPSPLLADLKVDEDGLAVGKVRNDTGVALIEACLLYGQWGYRLGDLKPMQEVEFGPDLNPIHVKTLLSRRIHPAAGGEPSEQRSFSPDEANSAELLEAMMFYNAVGGEAFTGLPNRYQQSVDLSRLLELGRAVFVARGAGPGSQLVTSDSTHPIAAPGDPSTIIYRAVFPMPPAAKSNSAP
jgi:hypothetical protein